MAAKNDVTGDSLRSRGPSKAYEENWEKIFGKPCKECKMKGFHKMDCSIGYAERYKDGKEN